MSEFKPRSLCILGRQPELGLVELESLCGANNVKPLPGAALLSVDTKDISFKRLGGTIKLAQVLSVLPTTDWQQVLQYLIDNVPQHMQHQPPGKFTLGLSIYGLQIGLKEQTRSLMSIKRAIKATGKSVRIIPNKTSALNSAQVLHNKLTTKGAWELLLVRDGNKTILAQSIFVQDIEAYGARDQARPRRDAKVGMLPPKLAQIMINLGNLPNGGTVLDPFCGTGVVMQEALLMGYNAAGTDIDARMVFFTKENIEWLKKKYPTIAGQTHIERGDAAEHKWKQDIAAVVSEIYLGAPLKKIPPPEQLHKIANNVSELLKKFLQNVSPQIKAGARLSLAVPTWHTKSGFVRLPILDNLSDLGYNQLDFKHVKKSDLVYFRENQIVARQLIVLEKK